MDNIKIANIIEGLEDTYIRDGLKEIDRKNIDDALHALCQAMDENDERDRGNLEFVGDLVCIVKKTVLKGKMPIGEDLENIKEIVKLLERK